MEERDIISVVLGGLALIVAGSVLLAVARAATMRRDPTGESPEPLTLSLVAWILISSGVVAFCIWMLGGVVGIIALFVLQTAVMRHQRAQQHMLLSTLAVAAQRQMPLVPAVEAFARECGGMVGWRAQRLAVLLESGSSLPDALEQTPGLASRQALVTIRAGQESGALPEALGDVVESQGLLTPIWNQTMGRLLYLGAVLLFPFPVATFMALRIAPEFAKIFEEFDVDLPPVTQAVIGASYAFGDYWFIFALPVFLVLLGLFVLAAVQYVGGFRWDFPLVNWLTRRIDTAVILEALALAADRNASFTAKIATLARWYPRRTVRRRLEAVLRDAEAGADWCESLERNGLIRQAELAVLEAAQRVGNLPWALREMAESSRRRLTYRLYALIQVLFPLAILALGLLVLAYVVGYFMPIIALIERMT